MVRPKSIKASKGQTACREGQDWRWLLIGPFAGRSLNGPNQIDSGEEQERGRLATAPEAGVGWERGERKMIRGRAGAAFLSPYNWLQSAAKWGSPPVQVGRPGKDFSSFLHSFSPGVRGNGPQGWQGLGLRCTPTPNSMYSVPSYGLDKSHSRS